MTVHEAADILKDLLALGGAGIGSIANVGTHSCKATLLSWLAKYGADPMDRRLLGGHQAPNDKSLMHYSRDCLAGPLRRLAVMLSDIRCGRFNPDSSRSGRFEGEVAVANAAYGGRVLPAPLIPEDADALSQSKASSAAGSEPAEDIEALESRADADQQRQPKMLSMDLIYFKHRTSSMIHILRGSQADGGKLRCGRVTSPRYSLATGNVRAGGLQCTSCFFHEPGCL